VDFTDVLRKTTAQTQPKLEIDTNQQYHKWFLTTAAIQTAAEVVSETSCTDG